MGRSGEWLGSSLQISLRGQLLAVTTPVSIATIRFTSHTHTTIFHTTTLSHITPQPSQEHTPTCHTTHSQSLHIHYPTPPHTDTLSLPTSLNSSSSRTWSPLISALSKKSTMVSSNTSSYTSAGVGETESQGPLPMHIPTQHSSKRVNIHMNNTQAHGQTDTHTHTHTHPYTEESFGIAQ